MSLTNCMSEVSGLYESAIKPLKLAGVQCDELEEQLITEAKSIISQRVAPIKTILTQSLQPVISANNNMKAVYGNDAATCKAVSDTPMEDFSNLSIESLKQLTTLHHVLLRGLQNPNLLKPGFACAPSSKNKSVNQVFEYTGIELAEMLSTNRDTIYETLHNTDIDTTKWKDIEGRYNSATGPLTSALPILQNSIGTFETLSGNLGTITELLEKMSAGVTEPKSSKNRGESSKSSKSVASTIDSVYSIVNTISSLYQQTEQAIEATHSVVDVTAKFADLKGVIEEALKVAYTCMKPTGLMALIFRPAPYLETCEDAIRGTQQFFNMNNIMANLINCWKTYLLPLGLDLDSLSSDAALNGEGNAQGSDETTQTSATELKYQLRHGIETLDSDLLEAFKKIIFEFAKKSAHSTGFDLLSKGLPFFGKMFGG